MLSPLVPFFEFSTRQHPARLDQLVGLTALFSADANINNKSGNMATSICSAGVGQL